MSISLDPQVIASIIAATGSVITAVIAIGLGKRLKAQERLKQQLETAHKDVIFLLEVEKEYGEFCKQLTGQTNKLNIRKTVRDRGHCWSGQFVASKLKQTQE